MNQNKDKQIPGALPIGMRLDGKKFSYRIKEVLGQGSFGITYKADIIFEGDLGELSSLHQSVAIKQFHMQGLSVHSGETTYLGTSASEDDCYAEKFRRGFQKEAINLSRMRHPGIVKVMETFDEYHTSYYVMEYLERGSLDSYIKQQVRLSEKESVSLIRKIGEALGYMHDQRMLHLDLKPGNIMLDMHDEPILIDFGLSRVYDQTGKAESSTIIGLGTEGYAPLEQATYQSDGKFETTLDIYALGGTLYKMLTGEVPPAASEILNHPGTLTQALEAAGISESLTALIQHAMHPLRAERIQTVSAFLEELSEAQPKDTAHVVIRQLEAEDKAQMSVVQRQKTELLLIQAEKLAQLKETPGTEVQASLVEEENNLLRELEKFDSERNIPVAEASVPSPAKPKKRFGKKVLMAFDVDQKSMDDDQLDLIGDNFDTPMLIAGCAGSGKSVIAMHKAQQIMDAGGDVILIAYTKSLNRYMSQNKENGLKNRFFYHWQWQHCGMPQADYIIVDEIQDFDETEIRQFVAAAKKCFFFFGDTAQSIYKGFGKQTLSIDEISKLTGVRVSYLYNNYRLPKPVARITQDYLGLEEEKDKVIKYSDAIYQSKENVLPVFVKCYSRAEQIERMKDIIGKNNYRNVGILVPDNEMVYEMMKDFTGIGFACEFKYNMDLNENTYKDTLDFKTETPKLMTYHSAKGLQFETVILPFYKGAKSAEERKALYVAMTRTYRNVYVLYDEILSAPLRDVPVHLYRKE